MKNKIRILIADDHMLLRIGLTSFISGKDDLQCVGEADNGRTAVERTLKLRPDVVIMDLMMPEMSGAEATRLIHDKLPETRIVVLTSYGTSKELAEAIANGASAALMKDISTADLVNVIRQVAAGKTILPPELTSAASSTPSHPSLTNHQLKILSSLAAGRSNIDIGKELGITENTVKKIVSTIFAKLGASSRAEAAAIAHREHLVEI